MPGGAASFGPAAAIRSPSTSTSQPTWGAGSIPSKTRAGFRRIGWDAGAAVAAALPLLESQTFDLLLTDIVMPEMDGIELAQRAGVIAPGMQVMFMTGFAAVALKNGVTPPNAKVLSKPFHLRDLVMEVDRMFQIGSATGA